MTVSTDALTLELLELLDWLELLDSLELSELLKFRALRPERVVRIGEVLLSLSGDRRRRT